jgi:hypothetical protein
MMMRSQDAFVKMFGGATLTEFIKLDISGT